MSSECRALELQTQIKQIQQALNALLIKNGAQSAPTQPTEPPTVVYRDVVECRRSGARRHRRTELAIANVRAQMLGLDTIIRMGEVQLLSGEEPKYE